MATLLSSPAVQRTPPGTSPPAGPIFGGPGTNGTVSLYHYGDLSSRADFSSTPGFPRLTDYDGGTSQADAATYTGAPISPRLKFKYEIKIDREFFAKNFLNTGTRKGYSEFGTRLKIPTTYFRPVATLTVAPPGGGGPPTPAGGAPPVGGAAPATPLKAKAAAGAALAALGANIGFNWVIGQQNEERIAAALAARDAELRAVQERDPTAGILLAFRFTGGADSGQGPTAAARFAGLSYVAARTASEARRAWDAEPRNDPSSRYDFTWIPPLSPVAAPPPGWHPVGRGAFADLRKVQFQRMEFAQIGGFGTDGTLGPHDFSTLKVAATWEFVILRVPAEVPYYGPGGGYRTKTVTVRDVAVTGGQVPAMIVDGTACVAVVAANSDTLDFFTAKGIAARTRIDDKVNALRAVVNIDDVRWLRASQVQLKG